MIHPEGEMGATRELVAYCHRIRYEDLSPKVVDMAKYLALDFLGVAARGSLVDSTKAMYGFVHDMDLRPKVGIIIGTPMKAPHQYAALANGTSAHSLELDDVVNEASLHAGVAVFPATMAACEMVDADGTKFIEGAVLGYEVMIRLGKALNPTAHYKQGFHPTGTCGAFAAAIAASKILGLGEEGMLNAIGIVGSQTAGSMEFLAEGAWTKRMHPGWAAHNGIIAALLARKGFKGPSTILEGRDGFLHAYSPSSDVRQITEDLGDSFQIMRTSIKPHACCRYKQAPIDGILSIMKQNDLKATDVEQVSLGILKTGFPIIVEPHETKYNPKSVVDAQFSMPFGAAVSALYGRAFLEEYTLENVQSREIRDFMSKVKCVEDPDLDREFPKKWPASVKITVKGGREYSARVEYPKGDPENPLSWEELIEKFKHLTAPVFKARRQEDIIDRTRSLEEERSIRSFAGIMKKSRAS
jgi:2-methylcitrate dehydratase PrpD